MEEKRPLLSVQLLWPELAPEDAERIDNESAILSERRAKAFRLYGRGRPMRAIAEELKCSPATVCRDVNHVLDAYRLIALQDAAAHTARELARLNVMEAELWELWERSKGEAVETYTGKRDGQRPTSEARVRKKQRDGDTRAMKLLIACWDRRCKLLGLLRDDRADPGKNVPAPLVIGGEADPEEL